MRNFTKKIVLVGAGVKCTEAILNYGEERIAYVFDNFKAGEKVDGISIIDFQTLKRIHQEYQVIVTIEREEALFSVCRQLASNVIPFDLYSENGRRIAQWIHIYGMYPNLSYDYFITHQSDRVNIRHMSLFYKRMFREYDSCFDRKKVDVWLCCEDNTLLAYKFAMINQIPYIFSYSTQYGIENCVVPVPDYRSCFDEAIYPFPETQKACKEASKMPVLDQRAFWIGNTSNHPVRKKLLFLSERFPEYLCIQDYTISHIHSNREEDGFVPLLKQPKYKYLIDVEGIGWTDRVKIVLQLGRPLLMADRPYREWYFNDLIPMKHFVPIKEDLSDLIDKIKYLNEHPEICEQIVNNAKDFCKEHFGEKKYLEALKDITLHYGTLD